MNNIYKTILAGACLIGSANGASNFVPGLSETVNLTGPFGHAGAIGDVDNATTTATFVGGFVANQVSVSATLDNTGGAPATWSSEAAINLTQPNSVVLGGIGLGGVNAAYTPPLAVSNGPIALGAGALDPAGTWSLEMFEGYDDAAGVDQFSSGIALTFGIAGFDEGVTEAMGALANGGSLASIGEFGIGGLFDIYTISLSSGGLFGVTTSPNASGLVGSNLDSELGLYDAGGVLLATNDDGGPFGGGGGAFYSELSETLAAGDYTVVVGGWDTDFGTVGTSTIGDIVTGVNGNESVGDYSVDFNLVPEPSSVMFMFIAMAGFLRRRR